MRYEINIEDIKKDYIKKDSFQHNAGSRISMLPYTTQYKESQKPPRATSLKRKMTNMDKHSDLNIVN